MVVIEERGDNNSSATTVLIAVIIVVIIGLALYFGFRHRGSGAAPATINVTVPAATTGTTGY